MSDTAPRVRDPQGHLTVITGPMFSGKTTYLLDLLTAGIGPVLTARPAADTRSPASSLRTHTGRTWPAFEFDGWDELRAFLGPPNRPLVAVGIDEAHLASGIDLASNLLRYLRQSPKTRMIVAGLLYDADGSTFTHMQVLVNNADTHIALRGWCASCGLRANHTFRKPGGSVIGGAESYEQRCAHCLQRGNREKLWVSP